MKVGDRITIKKELIDEPWYHDEEMIILDILQDTRRYVVNYEWKTYIKGHVNTILDINVELSKNHIRIKKLEKELSNFRFFSSILSS